MANIENTRIKNIEPLLAPAYLKHQMAISKDLIGHVANYRAQVADIIHGRDKRLLMVVGPCSIHDPKASVEYAEHLAKMQKKYSNELLILMRVYFEKPRTTIGWKGFINDPHLDNSCDINTGVMKARDLLIEINKLGLAVATEFLDTITPQYIADLVSWAAIGARTSESQVHRNLASGLSMPVGFKNGTTGNVQLAVDAVVAANNPHHFLSVTEHGVAAIVQTEGNADCHVILRGGSRTGPNYTKEHVDALQELLVNKTHAKSVMIDCSHGNSQKNHKNQARVLENVLTQIENGNEAISGVMIESFLKEGNQPLSQLKDLNYGQSVTDACIDLEETQQLLQHASLVVKSARGL